MADNEQNQQNIRTDILVEILGDIKKDPNHGKETTGGQAALGVLSVAAFASQVPASDTRKLIHKQWFGDGGDASVGLVDTIVNFITTTRKTASGNTVLIGLSSGATNAIQVAGKLGPLGIKLAYFASIDAAFTDENDPLRGTMVQADEEDNFFQTLSNFAKEEFHGNVASIPPTDFTIFPEFQQSFAEFQLLKLSIQQAGDMGSGPAGPVAALVAEKAVNKLTQKFLGLWHVMALKKGYPFAKSSALKHLS